MNKTKTKPMNQTAYERWGFEHPIRVWARSRAIPLSALAARLRVSPQTLNDWLRGGGVSILERGEPPYDHRVAKLCKLMKTSPESLCAEIAAWRDKGEELSL